jgi:hypothetical protein
MPHPQEPDALFEKLLAPFDHAEAERLARYIDSLTILPGLPVNLDALFPRSGAARAYPTRRQAIAFLKRLRPHLQRLRGV